MPTTVEVILTHPLADQKNFQITYHDPRRVPVLQRGWKAYNMAENPPEKFRPWTIWYRQANLQRQVEVSYRMPANPNYIPGRYRIDCFIPDQHASVLDASFAITHHIDTQGQPVEVAQTVNFLAVDNQWVSLGEYDLAIGSSALLGRVRQFDDSSQPNTRRNQQREISFGPIRWVPLYQMPEPFYVAPDDRLHSTVNYLDPAQEALLKQQWSIDRVPDFVDTKRYWIVLRRRRSTTRQLQVDFRFPPSHPPGRYRVDVFISALPASSHSKFARYVLKTNASTHNGAVIYAELDKIIDQSRFLNQWVSLGEFDFEADPALSPLVGQVSQFDDTLDARNIFITFGPVRWMPRFALQFKPSPQFDFPVGSETERAALIVKAEFKKHNWLEHWVDSTPFLTDYFLGLHTGADLNLDNGEDRDAPVYAVGDGTVIFAQAIPRGSWGHILIVEHPLATIRLPDGRTEQRKVYTRYGHVSPASLELVQVGQPVLRGQQIGFIGLMRGKQNGWHLHFDVGHTDLFRRHPEHWPNMKTLADLINARRFGSDEYRNLKARTMAAIQQDYLDPLQFIIDNHNPFVAQAET